MLNDFSVMVENKRPLRETCRPSTAVGSACCSAFSSLSSSSFSSDASGGGLFATYIRGAPNGQYMAHGRGDR